MKYWTIVMWCSGVENDVPVYRPSHAHHKGTLKHQTPMPTYELALQYAVRIMKLEARFAGLQALPTFTVAIVASETMPDITAGSKMKSTLRRISLGDDQ